MSFASFVRWWARSKGNGAAKQQPQVEALIA
jgi:hypothetical protein